MARRLILFFCFLFFLAPWVAHAAPDDAVYEKTFEADFDTTYEKVHAALEGVRFWVVTETRISDNLARFAERWGEDYNRNGLDAIRGLVVCNPWYTNQIANHDPRMLGLCPLGITIYTRDGVSHVLFGRPTALAGDSPAREVLQEVETTIIEAIEGAFATP